MRNQRLMRLSRPFAATLLLFTLGCSEGVDSREPESEQMADISGTLVKNIGRANDGTTTIEYFLKTKSGWVRLHGRTDVLESQEPNTRVVAQGSWSADHQELTVDTLEPAITGKLSQPLSSNAPKGRVAIFLIKDQSLTADPFSKQDAINTVLQGARSTNSYFQETSFGAYGLTGDVFGWYTANISNCGSFSGGATGDQIQRQAAAQDGFVTDNYRHAIHLFARPGDGCFYAFGTLGAPDGVGQVWSFINSGNTVAHEIGHNLGLHHANSLTCRNSAFEVVPFGARCQFNEYNDPYDGMGFDGFYYQFNSYSKSLQGWLPLARQRRVTAAEQVVIVPQETAVSSGTQSLIIPIPNSTQLFHVEMRKQFGFDSEPRFDGAVLVRRVEEPGLHQVTHLLDMSPDQDFSEAGLQVGQTFQDPLSGISITLTAKTASQATIDVAFNGPKCGDGVKNGTETGVDCGGLCSPCGVGQACVRQRDCSNAACSGGTCVASSGGLTGSYYTGQNFETLTNTSVDKFVDFDWGGGAPPGVPTDHFSVRWQGKVIAPETATYTFHTDTDDGVRLWVNDQLVIDRFLDGVGPSEGSIALSAGQQYDIRMDYFENGGGAYARLMWSTPTIPLDLIPPTQLLPVTAGSCTAQTAQDLGPRSTQTTVPSNSCVKVSQYPSWWPSGGASVTLQAGTGAFPVPATWQDACTTASGQFTFTNAWQTRAIGSHTPSCPAVIQLNGSGTPLQLTWW